jgi:hypothetical protein
VIPGGLAVLLLAFGLVMLGRKYSRPYWVDALLSLVMVAGGVAILGGVLLWIWE